jgi:hypothetical protein
MPKLPWLRLYTEIVDDPKIRDFTGDQFRDWIYVLCLARESSELGFINQTVKDMAWRLRRPMKKLQTNLELFADRGMIELTAEGVKVLHFAERQYDKPSDMPEATRDRKKKSRRCHADVTPESRDITEQNRTEQNRDRTETEQTPFTIDPTLEEVGATSEAPADPRSCLFSESNREWKAGIKQRIEQALNRPLSHKDIRGIDQVIDTGFCQIVRNRGQCRARAEPLCRRLVEETAAKVIRQATLGNVKNPVGLFKVILEELRDKRRDEYAELARASPFG